MEKYNDCLEKHNALKKEAQKKMKIRGLDLLIMESKCIFEE